jgi:hypothetical protein
MNVNKIRSDTEALDMNCYVSRNSAVKKPDNLCARFWGLQLPWLGRLPITSRNATFSVLMVMAPGQANQSKFFIEASGTTTINSGDSPK